MRAPLARRLAPLLLVLHSRLALATPREEQEGLVGGGNEDEEEITMA